MNRRATMLTVALAALAVPASSLAASSHGTVLSVDPAHRVVQVVNASHAVHAYRYGQLGHVKTGTRISFKVSGKAITAVRSMGKAPAVSFYAKVVRSRARALVLRLADGQNLTIGGRQLKHAKATVRRGKSRAHALARTSVQGGPITINIEGLQPGETVLITESTDAQGNPTITVELTGTRTGGTVSEEQSTGLVTDVQSDTFQVTTSDGSVLNLHMSAEALANLNMSICDQVTVSYHQDAGMFIADNVHDSGPSSAGACAGNGSGQDAIGSITSVSGSNVTIAQAAGQGPLTFTVDDPSITDGFSVGDVVDVTYYQLSDGSLGASDVQYVEKDATGVVTAVSAGSVTFTDNTTGNPDTFTADPSTGTFDGVQIGDQIDVTYHVTTGGTVVDNVDDGSGSGGLVATGVVTAVGSGSLTITDDSTGSPSTFTTDPSTGTFDGVQVGDQVDVTYHLAAGANVADSLNDNGATN